MATETNGTSGLSTQETLALITSNLQESLNLDIVENVLEKEKRPICIYWGTC